MYPGPPEYLQIMTSVLRSAFPLTVVVTVTGIFMMPVQSLRMI
jgi:hypothetical protein